MAASFFPLPHAAVMAIGAPTPTWSGRLCRRQDQKPPCRRPHRLASRPPRNPFASKPARVGEEGGGAGAEEEEKAASPRQR